MKLTKRKKILLNVIVGAVFYLLFSFSLFLGLQVNPLFGNIGVATTVLLLVGYIFMYRKLK